MSRVQYNYIGHNPRFGRIALYAMDGRGEIHDDTREYAKPDGSWLDWSHDALFKEVKPIAKGRVELGTKSGSIHIVDPKVFLSNTRLRRIIKALDERYPEVRWYVFSDGLNGVAVSSLLAERADIGE